MHKKIIDEIMPKLDVLEKDIKKKPYGKKYNMQLHADIYNIKLYLKSLKRIK